MHDLCVESVDGSRTNGPLLELISGVNEMNKIFVGKINSELSKYSMSIQICNFCDGSHDDLGNYLHDYHDQINEVWILFNSFTYIILYIYPAFT